MSVYKEGYHAIHLIESDSTRIFEDACDYGAPCRKGDSIWNATKQLVEWYGNKETKKVNIYSTGKSTECVVTLMDEWSVSDERKTVKEATENYLVSFTTCNTGNCRGLDGFVSVTKI